MNLRLPRYLKFGAYIMPIIRRKFGHADLRIDETKTDCDGIIDYNRQRIVIADGKSPRVEAQILFHEMIHGLLWSTDYNQYQKERFVNALATELLQVMLDSPGLLEYLIKIRQG